MPLRYIPAAEFGPNPIDALNQGIQSGLSLYAKQRELERQRMMDERQRLLDIQNAKTTGLQQEHAQLGIDELREEKARKAKFIELYKADFEKKTPVEPTGLAGITSMKTMPPMEDVGERPALTGGLQGYHVVDPELLKVPKTEFAPAPVDNYAESKADAARLMTAGYPKEGLELFQKIRMQEAKDKQAEKMAKEAHTTTLAAAEIRKPLPRVPPKSLEEIRAEAAARATGTAEVKPEPKGFDTMEEAVQEGNRVLSAVGKEKGLVATAEMGNGNKWIPKLIPNPAERYPSFMPAGTNLPPGYTFNRKTGGYDWKGEGTAPGMSPQASLDWLAMKKSALTINGPTFKRLIDNAEILAVGVKDPKTGIMGKPELDQVADLRDQVDDKLFAKINSDVQAFNRWSQWISYQVSDPKVARLKSKIMANVDTLASVYSGGGTVTSDFKMKFAQDLFEAGLSKEAFRAKLDTHKESVIDRARKYAEPNPAGLSDIPGAQLPVSDGAKTNSFSSYVSQSEKARYTQKQIYDGLIQQGWTKDQIVEAWRKHRGGK